MEHYEKIVKKIKALPIRFKIKGVITTHQNGIEREVVVLKYKSSEFVYVEGKENVILGWSAKKDKLGKNVIQALKHYYEESLEEYNTLAQDLKMDYKEQIEQAREKADTIAVMKLEENLKEELEELQKEQYKSFEEFMEEWNSYLNTCMSPLRKRSIGDMIVEVESQYLERDMSYEEVFEQLESTYFTLPTEDEWEYFFNGGQRTLFRWGDSLEEELIEIFQVGSVRKKENVLLNKPNTFGLHIGYNSYQYELIDDPLYFKGGDGGCTLCGGDGIIYVAPIYTAFYRDVRRKGEPLSCDFVSYRRIIRVE